ncbi:MAG: hypothetical protein SNJ59_03940 [Aggregatilineales bacterium]
MREQMAVVLRNSAGAALLAAILMLAAAQPAHGQIDIVPTPNELERTATAIIETATAQVGTPGLLTDLTPTPAFIDPNVEPMAATATALIEAATATAMLASLAAAEAQGSIAPSGADSTPIVLALAFIAGAVLFSGGYVLGRRSGRNKSKRSG